MFRSGDTIRHVNCLDVDLYIHKIQYRGPDYWKVRVSYILQRNGGFLGMDTVRIKKKDFKNWSIIKLNEM